jgi:flagellar basal body-associated protein FliL
MASRIKHIVEPAFGWLFILVLVVVIVAALMAYTAPTMEVTSKLRDYQRHQTH